VTKTILEGRTNRGKTVYPPPPSGSGGIIRSKIGSKCVDLIILILNLEEKNLARQEKKIYSDLTFSQYNHILAIFTV
jgi:hypothetical protein